VDAAALTPLEAMTLSCAVDGLVFGPPRAAGVILTLLKRHYIAQEKRTPRGQAYRVLRAGRLAFERHEARARRPVAR
jgi:hypothetical protein